MYMAKLTPQVRASELSPFLINSTPFAGSVWLDYPLFVAVCFPYNLRRLKLL
jgi:hypothetical protein